MQARPIEIAGTPRKHMKAVAADNRRRKQEDGGDFRIYKNGTAGLIVMDASMRERTNNEGSHVIERLYRFKNYGGNSWVILPHKKENWEHGYRSQGYVAMISESDKIRVYPGSQHDGPTYDVWYVARDGAVPVRR